MKLNYICAFVFMAALAACSALPETPAQKVFAATSAYNTALSGAVAYKALPACDAPSAPIACSNKSVVATLQKADTAAFEALSSAQTIVRDPSQPKTALETAALWAKEAAAAFGRVAAAVK